MADTSMQDAVKKRKKNKKIDKSMEDAIVNMTPIELAEYFTELKAEGYDDEAIAQLRAKAAENLAIAGTGKASEFMKKVKDKKKAAGEEKPEETPDEEPPKAEEEKPKKKKDMYADEEKPAKKKSKPAPEPVAEEAPEAEPVVWEPEDAEDVDPPSEPDPPARLAETPQETMDRFSKKVSDTDDGDDGELTLLIPDANDLFLCRAVADGYENVGEMVSGPWPNLTELKKAAVRFLKDDPDAQDELYVVKVVKKITSEVETKVKLVFK